MIIMLSLSTNLSICKSYYSAIDIFLMLYIIPLWLIYFLTRGFYLLIPFTSLAQPSKLLSFGDHQFAFCTYEPGSALLCLFLCFLYSTITETLCLSLTSLTIIPSGSIHIVTNGKISFLTWLSSVPLYIYINVCHIIFVHSSVDGHFSCIHILATLNNAALNIGVHIFFQISIFVFFRKIPRIRLLDCICCCCLVAKSCLTLCDPMFTCPPGCSVHGILQARILEWVANSFSRGYPDPGIERTSPALAGISLLLSHLGSPLDCMVE